MYFSRRIFHTFYAQHMFRLFSLNARVGAEELLGLQSLKFTFLFLYVVVYIVHAAIDLAASKRKKNNNIECTSFSFRCWLCFHDLTNQNEYLRLSTLAYTFLCAFVHTCTFLLLLHHIPWAKWGPACRA